MTAHACTECGMLHDTPVSTESAEVAIARIQADNALAIAKLQTRADTHTVEVVTEAEQEIAEIETDAVVAAAAVEGEIIAAGVGDSSDPEPEPGPLVIDAPTAEVDDEPDEAPPPADDTHQPTEPRKSRGLGMW